MNLAPVDRIHTLIQYGRENNTPKTFSNYLVEPQSTLYYSKLEVRDKIMGFDSMRRRKSWLNEGFIGNPCDSGLWF